MPHEQDFPLYTTDPTTGELVPVENDERTSAFGYFTFCRYISSAPFWANMPNADLVRLFYLSTYMLYERSTLCYSNGRQLTADSLPEVLQTSESTCRRFLAVMEPPLDR